MVNYIAQDIEDITGRTRQVVEMVAAVADMAATAGQQTLNARKSIHALNEQTAQLKQQVDSFLKRINR